MTNEELKTVLIENGVAAKDYEKIADKVDVSKISQIVEATSSPKEAFEALHAFNPALEIEELQKKCDFVIEQARTAAMQTKGATIELTEQELDSVAGGGLFDWFSNLSPAWKGVIIGVAVGAVCAIAFAGVGVAVAVGAAVKGAAFSAGIGAMGAVTASGTVAVGSTAVAAVTGSGVVGSAMAGFGIGVAAGVATGGLAGAVTTAVASNN